MKDSDSSVKARILVTGMVQGVGFRPFIAEMARKLRLEGLVRNLGSVVEIEATGRLQEIESLPEYIRKNAPYGSIVADIRTEYTGAPAHQTDKTVSDENTGFFIAESGDISPEKDELPVMPPDIGICPECERQLSDASDRRFRYPLISCALCGPRYSILEKLPYDRCNTTMDVYGMCGVCGREYDGSLVRKDIVRRHAQTISCPDCGPSMVFMGHDQEKPLYGRQGEDAAVSVLQNGGILGVKGTGGWQLAVKAEDTAAVKNLRRIKHRDTKPFAVMFHDISAVRQVCTVDDTEEELLLSRARPIVLLDRKENVAYSGDVIAPKSLRTGAFIPSTGAYLLLSKRVGPLIVTSANITGSPMITDDEEFIKHFADVTDGIWGHDRRIIRPLDDSVTQSVILGDREEPVFIRRSRGYVPLPVFLKRPLLTDKAVLAFGGDLKHSFAIGYKDRVILSAPMGDLDNEEVFSAAKEELERMLELTGAEAGLVVCDMHPGYRSSLLAEKYTSEHGLPSPIKIQHHHAHAAGVMAENGLESCIAVVLDGTGFGSDGHIWGGEILLCRGRRFVRAAHLKEFKLTGADASSENAGLTATCMLLQMGKEEEKCLLDRKKTELLSSALHNNIGTYVSTGAGRRFDAVSAILGICGYNSYEGEAATLLQNAAEEEYYGAAEGGNFTDTQRKLALLFHERLSCNIASACEKISLASGEKSVTLSGGCFHNRLLLELTVKKLSDKGLRTYINTCVSPGDGGISLGQVYLAGAFREED